MEHYNKISTEMEQLGFKVENDLFIYDNITYNNMIINGQQYQQPQHNYIYLRYIGEGYIKDATCADSIADECADSDSDRHDISNIQEISQFDFLNEKKEPVTTICVSDINDIKFFLGL
jgi:hypothetical protein